MTIEFSDKKVAVTKTVEISLTEADVENIMVTGLEGGIGYWAGLNNLGPQWKKKPKDEPLSTWAAKLLLDRLSIQLYDIEDPDTTWDLDIHKLISGYHLNAKERPYDSDIENGDATTAGCIIQYALFGEVVYG